MAVPMPPGFIDIPTAKSMRGFTVNVIGIVIDTLTPTKSRGSSFVSTFTLKTSEFAGSYQDGLKVKYFNNDKQNLPTPQVGDVVILHSLKLRPYQSTIIGLSTAQDTTLWITLKHDSTQPSGVSMTCRPGMSIPSPEEMKYARHLFKLYAGNEVRAVATSPALNYHAARGQSTGFIVHPPNTKADKFRLIKDAALHTYVDLVGQVVKTFSEYDKYILYVTDYTEHRQLYDYAMVCEGHAGDEFNFTRAERKWPGPYGRMTLQVTLWEPHASFARQNVRKDDFLLLRNVHIKFGQSQDAMEGVLHTDRLYPKKVDIKPLDKDEPDERLRDLVKRKLQYWGRIGADLRKGSQKRALETGDTNTKKPKKDNSQNYKNAQGLSKDDTQVKDTVTTVLTERDKLNRHILCKHHEVHTRSIRQILDNITQWKTGPGGIEYQLPFQNFRYRTSVRVIDFFPPNLEGFAVPYNSDNDILYHAVESTDLTEENGENQIDTEDESNIGKNEWEWRFCLLVEDGGPGVPRIAPGQNRERLHLFVAGRDAEFLLDMDAVNLRENPDVLGRLREKLFILWGNLEERKKSSTFNPNDAASIDAKPFLCCVKEYGVRASPSAEKDDEHDGETSNTLGWERRFRIFDTLIEYP